MRLAVMQPYIFPYLGYFQLLSAVDRFIFFDDVNFIKKGWIHRNQLLVSGQPHLFSVPLQRVSQNKLIKDTYLHPSSYGQWRDTFLKTVDQNYRQAPFFPAAYALLRQVLERTHETIADLAIDSVESVASYVGLETDFRRSSSLPYDRSRKGQDKIMAICQQQKATTYVNPIGGTELYDGATFATHNVALYFIKSADVSYPQQDSSFVSNLSIIDVLMFNDIAQISQLLEHYTLITQADTHD